MKKFIQGILKTTKIGRLIYEPLHRVYRLYSVPHRSKRLQKHGPVALAGLADIFKRRGIPAYALYGTLLGFTRDSGFIKHDDDMDFGVMPGRGWSPVKLLRTLLNEEKGFRCLFVFRYGNRITEFKVEYKKIPIDFFFFEDDGVHYFSDNPFWFPDVKYPNAAANSVRRLPEVRITELTTMKVFGIDVQVPKNWQEANVDHYGEHWGMPDKGGDYKKELYAKLIEMPGYIYAISKDEALATASE